MKDIFFTPRERSLMEFLLSNFLALLKSGGPGGLSDTKVFRDAAGLAEKFEALEAQIEKGQLEKLDNMFGGD